MNPALDLAARHLAAPASGWSIGTYGVLAEFARAPDEPAEVSGTGVLTARGAIRLEGGAAIGAAPGAIAYEVLSAQPGLWHHGVLFTLPAQTGELPARRGITELGPDRAAVRPGDRAATLFDLGFGSTAFAFCVRTADPALTAALRRAAGTPLLAAGRELAAALVAASPHRVACSRLARIEVYQPIAPEGGATPTGPHTHLLPRLLRPHQACSANIRLPDGALPGLALYPPHPAKDEAGVPKPFSHAEHAAFQTVFERFADGEARAAKAAVVAGVAAGAMPDRLPATRIGRQAARIALRQLRLTGAAAPALAAWTRALEPAALAPAA